MRWRFIESDTSVSVAFICVCLHPSKLVGHSSMLLSDATVTPSFYSWSASETSALAVQLPPHPIANPSYLPLHTHPLTIRGAVCCLLPSGQHKEGSGLCCEGSCMIGGKRREQDCFWMSILFLGATTETEPTAPCRLDNGIYWCGVPCTSVWS